MLTKRIHSLFKHSYPSCTYFFSQQKKQAQLQKHLKAARKNKPPHSPSHPNPNPNSPQPQSHQLPEHLQHINKIKKQTENLQVVSQSEIENEAILKEVKRQRELIQMGERREGEGEGEELGVFKYGEKFLIGLTGVNVGLASVLCLPIFGGNCYWLGVYSSCFLYPSLLFTTCAAIGTNLAYLIVRQGLNLHIQVPHLKKINLTQSPLSYYLQSLLLAIQFFSLSLSISLPLTVQPLQPSIRTPMLYSLLFFLLCTNAHNTYQRKYFNNPGYKIGTQSGCFVVLFLASWFVYDRFGRREQEEEEDGGDMGGRGREREKEREEFERGQMKVRKMWRTERIVVEEAKITDMLVTDKIQQKIEESKQSKTKQSQPKQNQLQKQKPKTNKIW